MHILNLEEFCPLDAYPALILYTPFYATKSFAITHMLMFHSVEQYIHWYIYMHCIAFVLALVLVSVSIYMSVFESPPHLSVRMDQDQTYSIGSPDLREDTLDDMLCRIHLQSDDPELLEQEAERDQLQQ